MIRTSCWASKKCWAWRNERTRSHKCTRNGLGMVTVWISNCALAPTIVCHKFFMLLKRCVGLKREMHAFLLWLHTSTAAFSSFSTSTTLPDAVAVVCSIARTRYIAFLLAYIAPHRVAAKTHTFDKFKSNLISYDVIMLLRSAKSRPKQNVQAKLHRHESFFACVLAAALSLVSCRTNWIICAARWKIKRNHQLAKHFSARSYS